MCGFTGFYECVKKRTRSEVYVIAKSMTQTLAHRGPDSADIWQDPDVPLVLGHRRLAILDLSAEGNQPMQSPSGRYMIAFNGEIYNHLELREQLQKNGHAFNGRSDTETLLYAIEHWGLNLTLQKVRGMFALALWDRKTPALHLIRDRFGKKPLYVGWAKNALVFGSELKALRAHPDFDAQIDKRTLALYTRYACVPAPHCIYENVWQLPPGHRLTLELETLAPALDLQTLMHPYWSAKDVAQDAKTHPVKGDQGSILQEFERLLSASIKDRMISDVPLGAFLSGGIDSSLIVALMQKISGTPVHTFTIGYEDDAYNEAPHAAKIAAHLGTQHHEHICTADDALNVIPNLPAIFDEPFADQSAIPTFLVSQFARKSLSVALSGDGGDELMGGYSRHVSGAKIWNIMRPMPPILRRALAQGITKFSPAQWQSLHKNNPHFGVHMHKAASILSLETRQDIYTRLTSVWDDLPTLEYTEAKLGTAQLPLLAGIPMAEQIMLWDTLAYLPNDILTKVDRASMANGLEARAPLLDNRLYDYVWRLPMEYKIRGGKGKWLLREILSAHIPQSLFDRPKQGFNIPIDAWLKGPLQDWAENLLEEKKLKEQGLFNPAIIRKQWNAHLAGDANNAQALWSILMFQAWQEKWL